MPRLNHLAASGALALAGLLMTGCGVGAQSPADKADACAAVAAEVAPARLAATPDRALITASADRLDARLSSVRDVTAHDAAVKLHRDMHSLDAALEADDQDKAAKALARARADVTALAKACGLSEAAFLGTP